MAFQSNINSIPKKNRERTIKLATIGLGDTRRLETAIYPSSQNVQPFLPLDFLIVNNKKEPLNLTSKPFFLNLHLFLVKKQGAQQKIPILEGDSSFTPVSTEVHGRITSGRRGNRRRHPRAPNLPRNHPPGNGGHSWGDDVG